MTPSEIEVKIICTMCSNVTKLARSTGNCNYSLWNYTRHYNNCHSNNEFIQTEDQELSHNNPFQADFDDDVEMNGECAIVDHDNNNQHTNESKFI